MKIDEYSGFLKNEKGQISKTTTKFKNVIERFYVIVFSFIPALISQKKSSQAESLIVLSKIAHTETFQKSKIVKILKSRMRFVNLAQIVNLG